jgi:hypothetical protein
MNEQTLIQAKAKYSMNVLAFFTLAFFVLPDIVILLIFSTAGYHDSDSYDGYSLSPEYMIDAMKDLLPLSIGLLVVGTVLAILVYLSKSELTVTNMRVYGRGFLGKRVDLPADSISAISAAPAFLRGVIVTTPSGKISFFLLENHEVVYRIMSQLLIERQNARANPAHLHALATAASTADVLKKYKELLDAGIISQEEFDAKEEQLRDL